jgi:hypothetical protein
MQRRQFIGGAGVTLASLSSIPFARASAQTVPAGPLPEFPAFASMLPLARIRATPDRIIDVSVCTRPFRAEGPRIEAQQLRHQTVIHNYGHGGSG